MTVADMQEGESGVILSIRARDAALVRKINVFGLWPGVAVTLLQRFPVMVLQSRYTMIAMDKQLAAMIAVRRKV